MDILNDVQGCASGFQKCGRKIEVGKETCQGRVMKMKLPRTRNGKDMPIISAWLGI